MNASGSRGDWDTGGQGGDWDVGRFRSEGVGNSPKDDRDAGGP